MEIIAYASIQNTQQFALQLRFQLVSQKHQTLKIKRERGALIGGNRALSHSEFAAICAYTH